MTLNCSLVLFFHAPLIRELSPDAQRKLMAARILRMMVRTKLYGSSEALFLSDSRARRIFPTDSDIYIFFHAEKLHRMDAKWKIR